jgi:hypothetical protein
MEKRRWGSWLRMFLRMGGGNPETEKTAGNGDYFRRGDAEND